jgi:hypothetical protein
MMKRIIIICTTVCILLLYGYGQDSSEGLKNLIEEGKWRELGALFQDDSYNILEDYFSPGTSVKIITSRLNNLTYKAKFENQGEIGVITFEEKNGRYFNLKIKNQIRPLYFIERFKKYKAVDVKLSIGDARLHFINGHFYESSPFQWLLLFKGKWRFYIKPGDREERLTLTRYYKRPHFSKISKNGIFILTEKDFLKKLPVSGEAVTLGKDLQAIYKMYRDAYGIEIKQFDEYWYLPFPAETNLVVFKKSKNSFYYYSHNSNQVPDTQLATSGNNRLILNYNVYKGLKLNFGPVERVSEMDLNIFFNPAKNYISGTSTITYKTPSSLRILQLDPGLKLVGNLDMNSRGLNVFRKKDKYYLMGAESDRLSLYYKGYIKPTPENFELFSIDKGQKNIGHKYTGKNKADLFYFLSRNHYFYPNPGNEFFKCNISVTVPEGLNCLVTGNLEEKIVKNAVVFKYSSVATKGISLVTGNFGLDKKVEAGIPINFYTPTSLPFPNNLDLGEIKEATDLFLRKFGPINLSAIDILLKLGEKEGGVSNNGFIVVNLPYDKKKIGPNLYITHNLKPGQKVLSPILLRERSEDHILHELAHQWWGGAISWKSYQDTWFTEGLAHFSVLYFLKKIIPGRKFNRITRKLKRWVSRHSDSGPIIYGNRLNLLGESYEAYQSVIYNKSALMFFMLMEIVGEQDFFHRLRGVLDKYRYRSITSSQFIRQFCGTNDLLRKFFSKWVYSRAIPLVELILQEDHEAYDSEEFKTVVVMVRQLGAVPDTDFVFPLKLRVTTQEGSSVEPVIVKQREQRFIVSRDSAIRAIDIMDSFAPVRERKQPRAPFQD